MNASQIAQELGIHAYPLDLDSVCASLPPRNPCSRDLLAQLEQEYSLLGHHYKAVSLALEMLPGDSLRYRWAQIVCTYSQTAPVAVSSRIPMPPIDGTPVGDLLPLFILISMIPDAIQTYRQKGFSDPEIRDHLSIFKRSLDILTSRHGRPVVD